jgi:DNA mismatch repair protein MLH1
MESVTAPPVTPLKPIHKLDDVTINRIAAGEIIQRPSAVIKEMLENSLDAKSTSIQILVKNGGLDYISIQDNGHGIDKDSLSILCERFTTSKITNYEDLEIGCSTYGFRGEALASISHVAHLTVLTKTNNDLCAYKAKYLDGILIPFKNGDSATPKPCAGVTGTTLTVEDLFYNMIPRRQALKSSSNEEYQRILDVSTRYAIHYGDQKISITCKKYASQAPDLHTTQQSSSLDNIKVCYGSQLARELLSIHYCHGYDSSIDLQSTVNRYEIPRESKITGSLQEQDGKVARFILDGYLTNANYSCKKSTCIIFINNRLVECQSLRKTIEMVYSSYLPRHTHPFLYLSLRMPYEDVDVNVHPTKKEVIFLFEEEILSAIHQFVTTLLTGANNSRVFYTQTLMTTPETTAPSVVASAPVLASSFSEQQHQCQGEMLMSSSSSLHPPTRPPRPSPSSQAKKLNREIDLVDFEGFEDFGRDNEKQEWKEKEKEEEEGEGVVSNETKKRKSASAAPQQDSSSSSPVVTATADPRKMQRKSVDPSKLIRTDSSASFIHQYFPTKSPSSSKPSSSSSSSSIQVVDLEAEGDDPQELLTQAQPLAQPDAPNVDLNPTVTLPDLSSLPLYCTECKQPTDDLPPFSSSSSSSTAAAATAISSSSTSSLRFCPCCQRPPLPTSSSSSTAATATATVSSTRRKFSPLQRTHCQYESVQTLIQEIDPSSSSSSSSSSTEDLQLLLKKHVFVGIVNSSFLLIQYDTKLFLVDYSHLLLHLFYQLTLFQFQSLPILSLENNPIPITEYIFFALDHLPPPPPEGSGAGVEDGLTWCPEDGPKDQLAEAMTSVLISKQELLLEYFSITVTSDGLLTSLPNLLEDYQPIPEGLPSFLLRLATEPNWESEMECFRQICKEIALFYSYLQPEEALGVTPAAAPVPHAPSVAEDASSSSLPSPHHQQQQQLQQQEQRRQKQRCLSKEAESRLLNDLLPAIKYYLIPLKEFREDGTFVQIADLKNLYKIFERC